MFLMIYDQYKQRLETPGSAGLNTVVPLGSTVVDIGANFGYFTRLLANFVGPTGTVLAVEPDETNFAILQLRLTGLRIAHRCDLVKAVVANVEGALRLHVNEIHPGDHHLSDRGMEVRSITLDGLLANRGWPYVSLVTGGLLATAPEVHALELATFGKGSLRASFWLRCIRNGRCSAGARCDMDDGSSAHFWANCQRFRLSDQIFNPHVRTVRPGAPVPSPAMVERLHCCGFDCAGGGHERYRCENIA